MKKLILKACLILVAATLFIIPLVGCNKEDELTNISVLSNSDESCDINGFNYDNYQVELTYKSGKTKIIELTPDMISEHDKLLFYKVGTHNITVNYKKLTADFDVTIKLNTFSNDIKFSSQTVVYNGKPHKIEVEGDIPAGTKIIYNNGNEFTNAAIYDLEATLVCEGYFVKTLTATLNIKKASYNLNGISFKDQEFPYDGKAKKIEISGSLPAGVSVAYKIKYSYDGIEYEENKNSAINANEYIVEAYFTSNNTNYEVIDKMSAKMTINKANYDLSETKLESDSVTYDGNPHSLKYKPGKLGSLSENDIMVLYRIDGKYVDELPSVTDVGTYKIAVSFVVFDDNYNSIEDIEATLEIKPILLDLSDVNFESKVFEYSGDAYSIHCNADKACQEDERVELPAGVRFIGYKEQDTDTLIQKIEKTDAGLYKFKALFECADANHSIEGFEAVDGFLEIKPKQIFIEGVSFSDKSTIYNGEEVNLEIGLLNHATLPDYVKVVYSDNNGQINAGRYEISATFESDSPNYEVENDVYTAVLTINKKKLEINEITFDDQTVEYTGEPIVFRPANIPSNLTAKYTDLNAWGQKVDSFVNVGSYTCNVKFESDNPNIEVVTELNATLTITPKHINLSDYIYIEDLYATYDGEYHQLEYKYYDTVTEDEIELLETIFDTLVTEKDTGLVFYGRYGLPWEAEIGTYEYIFNVRAKNNNYDIIFEPVEVKLVIS